MANEVTHALLQTNGGQVASVLSALLFEKLHDPTDLRALMVRVDEDVTGSDTLDVTIDAAPAAFAAATNETTGGQSNSAYTTSKFQLVAARYVIQYEITDLLGLAGGPVQLEQIVDKIMGGVSLTYTDLLTALFPSLANDVGPGSGNDLTVDDIYSAMFQLNSQSVPGPYACVLHPVQYNDFITSLRGETGAVQFRDATAEMLALRGPGYKGSWNGVDFWQSDSVTTVNGGADRSGAMFGQGCWAYKAGPVARLASHVNAGDILALTPELLVERNRDATNGMSIAIGNLYPSVAEVEDLRGCEIISDA